MPDVAKFSDTSSRLIAEREITHGRFQDNARIAQRLKHLLADEVARRDRRGQSPIGFECGQAIEAICDKISRIVAGDPAFADHWRDIAGYALLGERAGISEASGG